MPGVSTGTNLTIAVVLVLGVGYLIYQIDRRVKREGALFQRDASPKSRIYAFAVGMLIGGFVWLEWMVGIRLYLLLILAIALVGYSLGLEHLLEILQPKKTTFTVDEIEGVDWTTQDELKMQVQAGGRFVVFEYCLSFLYLTRKGRSKVYFIKAGQSYLDKSIGYIVISIFFGWTNPIILFQVLRTNFRGGKNVTSEILALFESSRANPKVI
jgi:hypothetical protein